MKAKSRDCKIFCMLVLLLSAIRGVAQMQTSVYFISQNDPRFAALIQDRFAPIYERLDGGLKASTFVLNDEGPRSVTGYVIKWNLFQDGVTRSKFEAFDRLHLIGLSGVNPAHYWLTPHSARLVNPVLNIFQSEANSLGTSTVLDRKLAQRQIATDIAAGAVFTPTLDLVVFDDGTFTGPDEAHFSQRMISDRNGKHDAGVVVLLSQQRGESIAAIQEKLENDVTKTIGVNGTTEVDFYLQARSRYATQLLTIFDKLGSGALVKNATIFARLSQLKLKRID